MNKVKICVPTKDEGKVFKGHMGDSDEFMIYEMSENGEWKLLEKRKNTPFEEEGHGSQKKMQHILQIVGDCDVFVGGVLSPNFLNLRDKKPIQPVVSKFPSIEDSLRALSKEFKTIHELVQKRKAGEHPRAIPLLSENGVRILS